MKQLKRTKKSQPPRYSGNAITKSHSIKKNKKNAILYEFIQQKRTIAISAIANEALSRRANT